MSGLFDVERRLFADWYRFTGISGGPVQKSRHNVTQNTHSVPPRQPAHRPTPEICIRDVCNKARRSVLACPGGAEKGAACPGVDGAR